MTWGGQQDPGDYTGSYVDPTTGQPVGQGGSGYGGSAYGGLGYGGQNPYAFEPQYDRQYGQPGHGGQQQYPQQPYGQPPYGQPQYPGQYPASPYIYGTGQPARKRTGLVVLAIVGVVVLVGGGVTAGVLLLDAGGSSSPVAAAPSSSSAPSSQTPQSSAPTSSAPAPSTTKPATRGWQGVLSADDGLAYDVPPGWEVNTAGTIVGFEEPDTTGGFGYSTYISGHASAEFAGKCGAKEGYRAQTAVLDLEDNPLRESASNGALMWMKGATMREDGTKQKLSLPKPVPVTLSGGAKAQSATLTAKVPEPSSKCPAKKAGVTAVAAKIDGYTKLLVVYADKGVPDGVDPATLDTIARSLRPAG